MPVYVTKDRATESAVLADKRYKSNAARGYLDGIPVAVKDNFCTKGIPTTCASKMLANFVPPYTATVVKRLEDSGAIVIGKTNLDEFAMGSGTVDSIFGPTHNVWGSELSYSLRKGTDGDEEVKEKVSDKRVAGGSSGGSAIAVATGSCFAALGSDTGGSTRNPASYCGVVGFKPTYGRVSRYGLIPLVNSMDVPGIIARTVQDTTDVFNTIAGHDPMDPTTVSDTFTPVTLPDDIDISKFRIGIPKEYHCPGLSPEVLDTWSWVADLLEEAGASVTQVSMPHTPLSIACYSVLNQCEVASNMARYDGLEFGYRAKTTISTEQLFAETRSQAFNSVVRGRILAGNYFLLQRNYDQYFVQAMKVRRLISEDFTHVWDSGVDILLAPTTLTEPPTLHEFINLDNRAQCVAQDYCTQPANMTGCPAISIPIRLSQNGLPLSLQLLSPNFTEDKLLAAAKWIETAVQFPILEISDS